METIKRRVSGTEVIVTQPKDINIDKTYFKGKSNSNGGSGGQSDSNKDDSNSEFWGKFNQIDKIKKANYKQLEELNAFRHAFEKEKQELEKTQKDLREIESQRVNIFKKFRW